MEKLNQTIKKNLELINQFVFEITKDPESIDETLSRVVGLDNYNPCNVFEVVDMFLTLYDVFEYYICKSTPDQFIDWYWWDLENKQDKQQTMSLKNYLIYVSNRSQNN